MTRTLVGAASADGPFDQILEDYEAYVTEVPVDRDGLMTITGDLESSGLRQIGANVLTTQQFAEAMHRVFTQVAELEIEPPLTDDQKLVIGGQLAKFASMLEVAQPKGSKAYAKPTDTAKANTDKAKK